MRLDDRKVLCAPDPRTKNFKRLFFQSINYITILFNVVIFGIYITKRTIVYKLPINIYNRSHTWYIKSVDRKLTKKTCFRYFIHLVIYYNEIKVNPGLKICSKKVILFVLILITLNDISIKAAKKLLRKNIIV